MLEAFKHEVCEANRRLADENLATLNWGAVSGYDKHTDTVAIMPAGVAHEDVKPQDIVLVDLDGDIIEGRLEPCRDTPTHCLIYKAFHHAGVYGVCHMFSPYATMYAQARMPIPCMGMTHADYFYGEVPVTRDLTEAEVAQSYEADVGRVIIETFRQNEINPALTPAVLVAGHAPFAWGPSADHAVNNAIALEAVAQMCHGTTRLNPSAAPLPKYMMDKRRNRKHRSDSPYGQRLL